MSKLLGALLALLLLELLIIPAAGQAPESVTIKTDHYIEHLTGKPPWIKVPECEEVEFRWVHGVSRCGCPDGDDFANGYNDFDYAWKLSVPKSGLINLEYAQACSGGDSLEVFVATGPAGPWRKAFTIDIVSYCFYEWNPSQPYLINLKALGLTPETEYYFRLLSTSISMDIFKFTITAQATIPIESFSWGAIKAMYH